MNTKVENPQNDVLIYQSNGDTRIDVRVEDETVWLTIDQMSSLFNKSRSTINEHILNVYSEQELVEESSKKKIGNPDFSTKPTNYYNLDVIISVGYRVKSVQGTQFRIWATQRLREYLIKGFSVDDERLKDAGGGAYWKELLDTIKDIRSSEKVLYRQVLDLYATSVDYQKDAAESKKFFAIVQNKLHYAANGKTASEIISERANADKPFMGLMTFGAHGVRKSDTFIAKNYLTEKEIKRLNNIVSAYFDIAELRAIDETPTTMQDYIEQLDKLIASLDRAVLSDAGKVSKIEAQKKATEEYIQYQAKTLSAVEEEYLKSLKEVQKKVEKKGKV